MKYTKIFGALILGILLSCQNDESSFTKKRLNEKPAEEPAPDNVPYGYINNQRWYFQQGKAQILSNQFEEYLVISLWNEVFEKPCSETVGSALQAKLFVKRVKGRYPLASDPFINYPAIVFTDLKATNPFDHIVANEGAIYVEEINNNKVVGAFMGQFTSLSIGRTEAKGRFEVVLCPSSQ